MEIVYLLLALLILVLVVGTFVTVRRTIDVFRAAGSLLATTIGGLEHVVVTAGESATHIERAAASSERLASSLERLHTSRARLTVLVDALQRVRSPLTRARRTYLRK